MDIETSLAEVRTLLPRAALAREDAGLRRDELDGSLAIGASPLTRGDLDALLDRGITLGPHRLEAYLAARDLAAAAAWVAGQRPLRAGDPRPLLGIDDVRRLHGMTTASRPESLPGAWRLAVPPPVGGVVSPPPWMVPFEVAALVDRVRHRTAEPLIPWIATILARFARIAPFVDANGQTGRLVVALLLRRLDLPPLAIPRDRAADYRRDLRTALAGNRAPLADLLHSALDQGCSRLLAAGGDEPLLPLRTLAGPSYAALIKAAKRGRLRSVVRDGRVLSTSAWIAAYRVYDRLLGGRR